MNPNAVIVIAVFIAAAVYVAVRESVQRTRKMRQKISDSWGRVSDRKLTAEELEVISHYAADCRDGDIPCDETYYVDDITWNDTNMNEVFGRMNTCLSSVGQEYLYKMLRLPFNDVAKISELDAMSDFFKDNRDRRQKIQEIFYHLGFAKKISVSDYVGLLMELRVTGNAIHYLCMLLIVLSIIVTFGVNASAGIIMFVATTAFSIITYYSCKAKVEPYYICMLNIIKMTDAAKRIARSDIGVLEAKHITKNDIEAPEAKHNAKSGILAIDSYRASLRDISDSLSEIMKGSWLLASANENGSIAEILMDYLRMVTHVDIIKFNRMLMGVNSHRGDIYEMMRLLGFIESSIAVASYRESLEYWCKPEFTGGKGLEVREVYHPCIESPVANSITAGGNVLITGSNASGKSTFLKTIAINALLAQAIGTSLSKMYAAPVYRIYSSMALTDNLAGHDSYYIVEIKSLKRILDSIDDGGTPVLMFVDEVLRGTNTVERIAASSQILDSLSNRNVLCFAATHDIELTKILEKSYRNYHFQEDFDEDVVFNYKLMSGAATSRNAIRLLAGLGYDRSITESAEKMANRFMQTGEWV